MYNSLENFNYYSDPRTIAQLAGSSFILGANKSRQQLFLDPAILYTQDEEDNDDPKISIHCLLEKLGTKMQFQNQIAIAINAPIHNALCPMCQGEGTVVDPNIDSCGLSDEDFDEDPEFHLAYHAGRYDIECPSCKGNKIIHTINYNQVREGNDLHAILTIIKDAEEERYQLAEERAHELKWGY